MSRRRRNPIAPIPNPIPTHAGAGMIRLNPLSMNEELFMGLLAAGVIGGGGYWWYKRGNPSVTVVPGTMTTTAKVGGTVTLKLPAGASWLLVGNGSATAGGAAVASGNAPYAVTSVTNGEVIAASWKDASGSTQATSITVSAT
jgi:hypothetical protein